MAGRHLLIAASAGSTSLLVLVVGAIALAVLVVLSLAIGRVADDGPLAAWWHAWREAGYRAGGVWTEFVDWLRTGTGTGPRPRAPRDRR